MKILKALLLALFLTISLQAQGIRLTGYARNYVGVLLKGNHDYAIIQNTFNLNVEKSGDKIAFKVNPFLYQYPNQKLDLGLREAYLDMYFPSMDLRIGKQQIIWGKADGVFITDIVSPKDLSEFLLRDFDEIRMGITSIKADYYIGDNTFEMVWIPTFTPTKFAPEGSIWRPAMPEFPAGVKTEIDHSREQVQPNLKNSEAFAKFSALTEYVDFEVMAGYAWDDDPTMHVVKQFDFSNPQAPRLTGITVYPEHHRLTIGGGSFSTTIGPFVLRGEGAYYAGKYFNTRDPHAKESVVKKNYLHYLLGLDYTLMDWHLSGQFIQQAILDYNDYIKNDQYSNMATFLATKDFLNETLDLSFFMYYDFNNKASLIRPKITYDFADAFEILLGANLFTGTEGMFGQFHNNSMVYWKIKYSF